MEKIDSYKKVEEECQIIKPSTNVVILLLQSLGATLVVFFFGAWFVLGPFIAIIGALMGGKGIIAGVIGVILFFFIILAITYFIKKASLDRTEYRFYNQRVEYFEGFLVKNRKTISYDKISNVGQRKGIIEGFFGLGTVYLDTPGSSAKGHELSISMLENPDQIFDWISKTVSKK